MKTAQHIQLLSLFGVSAGLAISPTLLCGADSGPKPPASDADVLLNLFEQKGLISPQDVEKARAELAKRAAKEPVLGSGAKLGFGDWVTGVKFNGDFRGRFEGFYADNPASVDRNRFQYRLRAGVTFELKDQLEAGFRLATEGITAGNPISSNQMFDNNASKKGVSIDLAYGKWHALRGDEWSLSLGMGKLENPIAVTPLVIDPDYTPEGFSQQLAYRPNKNHTLKLNAGQFVLEELAPTSHDAYLFGGQALWDAKWGSHWQTSLGAALLGISGRENLNHTTGILNINEGNTHVGNIATGAPHYNFNPIVVDGAVTYVLDSFPGYPGHFPIRVAGEYLNNPSAPSANEGYSAKLTFGKAGKKGQWEAGYEFRELQADAIWEELSESDFSAFNQAPQSAGAKAGFVAGTNIRGHIVRLGYSPFDALTFNVSYWITENIRESPAGSDSDLGRLQMDAIWKF